MLGYILTKQRLRKWNKEEPTVFPDYSTEVDDFQLLIAKCTKRTRRRIFYSYKLFVSRKGQAIKIFHGQIIKILYWLVHRASTNEEMRFQKALIRFGARITS